MAPTIPPKPKSDCMRPQQQDGQPAAISHPHGPPSLSNANEVRPKPVRPKPEQDSWLKEIWKLIVGPIDKSKRGEEFIDLTMPIVVDALANQPPHDSDDATERSKLERREQAAAAGSPPRASPSLTGAFVNGLFDFADAIQGDGESAPEPDHRNESLAEHVERKFWGLIFGNSKAVHEKDKRGEEIVDPETPEVAEALARESLDAATATESEIIDLTTPFVADELARQSLESAATESKIIDPTIPFVAEELAKQSPDRGDSAMESKAASKPRPNHHTMRECAHSGHMCVPRLRGHAGRPKSPKGEEDPEGKDPKGKSSKLERRIDFPGAMAGLPSSVICRIPGMEDTWICPKVEAREAKPAGAAAMVPFIVAAGEGGSGVAGVHGGSSLIAVDDGMPSTGLLLLIMIAVGIVALCSGFGLARCLKRRSRRRAARCDEVGGGDAVVVELREMKGVEHERDESRS